MTPRPRARRRNLLVTVAMVFAVFTGFAFVLPFLPLYVRELGVASPSAAALWAGVLIGVAPLLAGLLAPVWGRLADRHGHKGDRGQGARRLRGASSRSPPRSTNVGQLLALRDRHRPLRRHRPARPRDGDRAGAARGHRPRGRPDPGRADPLRGDRPARRRAPGRRDRHPAHVPGHRRAVRGRARAGRSPSTRSAAARADGGRAAARVRRGDRRCPGCSRSSWCCSSSTSSAARSRRSCPCTSRALGVAPARLASATGLLISVYSLAAAALGDAARAARAGRSRPAPCCSRRSSAAPPWCAPMALVPRFELVLGLAVLLGLVSGGSLTLCYTIGGLMVPEEVRTTAFGFFSGAALFGGALSPSVAGLVAHASPARHLLGRRRALPGAGRGARPRPGAARARSPGRGPLELESRHEALPPLRPRAPGPLREGRAHRRAARTATPT